MKYEISMEIAGPLAMWARPDTGSSPSSYPIPTWSAAKGIFESVAFFRDGKAWINPTRVEICREQSSEEATAIAFQKYTTNYGGPLRESSIIKKKASYQFAALAVTNPCYRLYATIENGSGRELRRGDNPCHYLQDKFQRRLKTGKCHHTPCLGWSEFTPSYWGPLRDGSRESESKTCVNGSINLNLVSFLKKVFTTPLEGKAQPEFYTGDEVKIKNGVFHYA